MNVSSRLPSWLRDRRRVTLAVATVGGIVFVVFVWPTLYRYDHLRRGPIEMLVRINRFTGHAECFVGQQIVIRNRDPKYSPDNPFAAKDTLRTNWGDCY